MAKAGFWLRGAKGKLAGSSIGKGADGSTVIREIVTPRNPKTEKQIYQRAIMSTVMLAYSQGKEIFDHAFEGYAKGGENQRRFTSVNARRLRAAMADDFGKSVDDASLCLGRAVPPKALTTAPWTFQISEGTYQQGLFNLTTDDNDNPCYILPPVTEAETPAAYAARLGLIAGDIYTIVMFVRNVNAEHMYKSTVVENGYGIAYLTDFAFARLIVKAAPAAEGALTTVGQIFDVARTVNIGAELSSLPITTEFSIQNMHVNHDSGGQYWESVGAIGLIRSRFDVDLRSTSYMSLAQASAGDESGSGLTYLDVLPAWRSGDALGNSELILEGADF